MKLNIISLALILFCAQITNAEDLTVLKGLPSNEQVFATIKGKNLKETYQMQVGALKILFEMTAYDRLVSPFTVENDKVLRIYKDRYNKGLGIVYELYSKNIASLNIPSEKRDLFNVSQSYVYNNQFRQEVIRKLLAPRTQKVYYDKLAEQEQKEKSRANAKLQTEKRQQKDKDYRYNYKFMDKGVKPVIFGLFILLIGILIWRQASRTRYKNNKNYFEGKLQNIGYDKAVQFDRSQKWAILRIRIAFIICIIGVGVIIMGASSIIDYFD